MLRRQALKRQERCELNLLKPGKVVTEQCPLLSRHASIRTPDEVESAVKAAEQDVAAVTVSLRSRMLREVEKSLKRIADGTYGVCEGCDQEISPNRLKAIPWTQYCLACQELLSRN